MEQDSSQIRAEIEQTRARMGETVEALKYKADVPARVREKVSERVETVKGTLTDVVDNVKSAVGGAGSRVGDRLQHVKETANSTLDDTGDRVAGIRSGLANALPDPSGVSRTARRGVDYVAQNPLAIVLGSFAAGLVAGLLIPVSDFERAKVGPLRDELMDRAVAVQSDALEHGKAVLKETADAALATATQAARTHGSDVLDGDLQTGSLVGDLIEHGKQIAGETLQSAAETAQRSAKDHGRAVVAEARGSASHEADSSGNGAG